MDAGAAALEASRRGRWLARLSLAVLLVAAGGCATAGAARARLGRELAAVRCEHTLDESWDEARRLLSERGFPLGEADSKAVGQSAGLVERAGALGQILSKARDTHAEGSERVLETAWNGPRRYRMVGAPDAPGCHVAFLAIREEQGNKFHDAWEAPARDLALELELLRRLAPEAAAGVEAAVAAGPGAPAASEGAHGAAP